MTECERINQWLDEAPEQALAGDLAAHAAQCETCRRRLAFEESMHLLGAGATLDPQRRSALVEKIVAAPVQAARGGSRVPRWSWAPIAAAAAIIMAVVFLWPAQPREPILPTQILGDLLGPLASLSPASAEPAPSPETADDSSPLGSVFESFWGDLEGPVAVGLAAMEAPRAAATSPSAEKR
jgi:hypothetical protein